MASRWRRYAVGKTKREVMEIIRATDTRGPHIAQRFVLQLNGRTGSTADALGSEIEVGALDKVTAPRPRAQVG